MALATNLLIVFLVFQAATSESPCIKAAITTKAIDYLLKFGEELADARIGSNLPFLLKKKEHVPFSPPFPFQRGYVDLNNIILHNFRLPRIQYELMPEMKPWIPKQYFKVTFTGGFLKVRFTLSGSVQLKFPESWINFPHFDIDVAVGDFNFELIYDPERTLSGNLALHLHRLDGAMQHVDVKVNLGGLLNVLEGLVNLILKDTLISLASNHIRQQLHDIADKQTNRFLQEFPMDLWFFDGKVMFSYPLSHTPEIHEDFVVFPTELYIATGRSDGGQKVECQIFKNFSVDDVDSAQQMVYARFPESVFNEFSQLVHTDKYTTDIINKQTWPGSTMYMRTSCPADHLCSGTLIPELKNHAEYISLRVEALRAPKMVFKEKKINIHMEMMVQISPHDSAELKLLEANVDAVVTLVMTSLNVDNSGNVGVFCRVSVPRIQLANVKSSIGEEAKNRLENVGDTVKIFVADTMNEHLKKGVYFKLGDAMRLVNPKVKITEKFLELSTNVKLIKELV